jgi:hypothetical protein
VIIKSWFSSGHFNLLNPSPKFQRLSKSGHPGPGGHSGGDIYVGIEKEPAMAAA